MLISELQVISILDVLFLIWYRFFSWGPPPVGFMKRVVSISGPCFTVLDGWRKQFAGEITLDQLTHNYHFEDRCHLAAWGRGSQCWPPPQKSPKTWVCPKCVGSDNPKSHRNVHQENHGILGYSFTPPHSNAPWESVITGSWGKKGFKEYDIAADRGQGGLTAWPRHPIQNDVPFGKIMTNIVLYISHILLLRPPFYPTSILIRYSIFWQKFLTYHLEV